MRVLVTGISGFAGSYVASALAAAGYDIVGVHRRDTPFLARLDGVPRIRTVRTDLTDAASLPGPFEVVVHVAATSPVGGIATAQLVRDNVPSSLALLAAAQQWQCRAFILFSSISLYGQVTKPVLDESCPIVNPDAYGTTKHLAELLLAEGAGTIPSLALRLPGVIGPGAHRNWLAGVAEKLLRGDVIRAFHLEAPFNNAAHIADISELVINVIARGWTGFDAVVLGARGSLPVRAVIKRLGRGLDVVPRIAVEPPAKASFILSSQRAIESWGYSPMEIGEMIDRYAAEVLAEAS